MSFRRQKPGLLSGEEQLAGYAMRFCILWGGRPSGRCYCFRAANSLSDHRPCRHVLDTVGGLLAGMDVFISVIISFPSLDDRLPQTGYQRRLESHSLVVPKENVPHFSCDITDIRGILASKSMDHDIGFRMFFPSPAAQQSSQVSEAIAFVPLTIPSLCGPCAPDWQRRLPP